MTAELQVYRQADRRAMPWKNGGGETREVLRMPEGDAFDWRVSVAQIDRAGPFSDFAGYTRHMALLAGQGVRLHRPGGMQELRQAGDLIEFDGAESVYCELLGGSCTDLNLIVARQLIASVRILALPVAGALEAPANGHAFLFALHGSLLLSCRGHDAQLGPWDAALWSSGATLVTAAGDAPSAVFFATIAHGRQPPAAAIRP